MCTDHINVTKDTFDELPSLPRAATACGKEALHTFSGLNVALLQLHLGASQFVFVEGVGTAVDALDAL